MDEDKRCETGAKIHKFMNSMPDSAEIEIVSDKCFIISWTKQGRGFGEYAFFQDKNGQWKIDNETDSRQSIKDVLGILVDSLPLMDVLNKETGKWERDYEDDEGVVE